MTRRDFLRASTAACALPLLATDSLALFDFRRNFWINLHHFLYQQARLDRADREAAPGFPGWTEGVAYYNENLIARSLLDDEWLLSIKQRLSGIAERASLRDAGLDAALEHALDLAAPVYRRLWWPQHDTANAIWLQSQIPRIAEHGSRVAGEIGRVLDFPWPAGAVHTEISYVASANGAYSTRHPLFLTIASADPRNQGDSGFEILFHEAAHGVSGKLHRLLEAGLAARGKTKSTPPELEHAVLFYCVGEVIRQAIPGYVPYAQRMNLWDNPWPRLEPVIAHAFEPLITSEGGALTLSINSLIASI